MSPAHQRQAGFTYLGLLFAIVILGLTLSTVGVLWSTQARREREAELLFVGDQYRQAIGRYYTNGGFYPRSLDELLEDKRVPFMRRQLRRLYPDPMSGSPDWQLVLTPDGAIMGVASSSQGRPIKVAGFRTVDAAFAGAQCYCDWKFIYTAPPVGGRRVLEPPPSN